MSTPNSHFFQEATFNNVAGDYNDHRRIYFDASRHPLDREQLAITDIALFNSGKLTVPKGLEQHISKGAAHDSAERGPDAPKCDPETRIAVQQDILSWIGYGHQATAPTNILYLSGPAGSGKTAIAGSIADTCHSKGWLAASFFLSSFAPSPDRCSKDHVIPTLAYHLLHQKSIPGLRDEILAAIADNPSVFSKRLLQQLQILILGPLRGLGSSVDRSTWPKVIVIDGVDECGADQGKTGEDFQRSRDSNYAEIISVLAHACADPSFPFRIIIASRPERAIRFAFTSISTSPTPQPIKEIFLDDKYSPATDIRLFVHSTLTTIGREKGLREDWFSAEVPRLIAEEASGQFIYAATVLRFVRTGSRPPHEQLERVLEWRRFDHSESKPFASLDALYRGILETSPNPLMAVKWLYTIHTVSGWEPFNEEKGAGSLWNDECSKALLESYPGEAVFLLGGLTSLVAFTEDAESPSLKFYHKSLLDFLKDRDRSNHFHVTVRDLHELIWDRCYRVLKSALPPSKLT